MARSALETTLHKASQRYVGIYGGTFDPIHNAHLALARQVRDHFMLDAVLVVPASCPPHKRQPAASFADRVAMIQAALATCADCNNIVCSRIEDELPYPSYTIQTVEKVMQEGGPHTYALIIGLDSLVDIPGWYRAEDLLSLVDLLVVNRGNTPRENMGKLVQGLTPAFVPVAGADYFINQFGKTVHFLDTFEVPISSTVIRRALRNGQKPDGVPEVVLNYILKHGLYRGEPPS